MWGDTEVTWGDTEVTAGAAGYRPTPVMWLITHPVRKVRCYGDQSVTTELTRKGCEAVPQHWGN